MTESDSEPPRTPELRISDADLVPITSDPPSATTPPPSSQQPAKHPVARTGAGSVERAGDTRPERHLAVGVAVERRPHDKGTSGP